VPGAAELGLVVPDAEGDVDADEDAVDDEGVPVLGPFSSLPECWRPIQ
jgi:hypothetical protein